MSLKLNYVMQNTLRFKQGKRSQANKQINQFLSLLTHKIYGFRGYLIINSLTDNQTSMILTFWENKQNLDSFYNSNNNLLSDFAKNLMLLVEKTEQIQNYQTEIADFPYVKIPLIL